MPWPVNEEDVNAAEVALGVELPASYRRRIMRENGGGIETGTDTFELFKILDRTNGKRLARTSATSIVRENQAALEWEGFSRQTVAIAANGAGDYLVYLRDGDRLLPELFLWDHETAKLHHVAEDLADLLGT